jgi:hypothetical protein
MKNLLRKIKPFGPVSPMPPSGHMLRDALNMQRAYLLGIRDGWQQPRALGTSANVDHLDDGYGNAYEACDRGINLGQWLRSPFNHQQQR